MTARSMTARILVSAGLLGLLVTGLAACEPSTPKRVPIFERKPDPVLIAQAESGRLPEDPIYPLVKSKCSVCHTDEYLTQQRLTPDQWKRTVVKMQKFGAPIDDDEVVRMSEYLSTYFTTTLREAPSVLAELPAHALPPR